MKTQILIGSDLARVLQGREGTFLAVTCNPVGLTQSFLVTAQHGHSITQIEPSSLSSTTLTAIVPQPEYSGKWAVQEIPDLLPPGGYGKGESFGSRSWPNQPEVLVVNS